MSGRLSHMTPKHAQEKLLFISPISSVSTVRAVTEFLNLL